MAVPSKFIEQKFASQNFSAKRDFFEKCQTKLVHRGGFELKKRLIIHGAGQGNL
ncbi:MAG: hypothetical protein ABSB84_15620 [Verrucomicrobiota bacterium]|jgi:hypothetical protein